MTAPMPEQARSPTRTGRHCWKIGADFVAPSCVGHRVTGDGVSLILPAGRALTDAEARKLAWGILADLAPEEVAAAPTIVTYREAQRLMLLQAMREGAAPINALGARVGFARRVTERLLQDLLRDGRAQRLVVSARDVRFGLSRVSQ